MWGGNPSGAAKKGQVGVLIAFTLVLPIATASGSDSSENSSSASSTFATNLQASETAPKALTEEAKEEVIVRFREDSSLEQQRQAVAAAGGKLKERLADDLINAAVVEISGDATRSTVMATLEQSDAVKYADPNSIVKISEAPNDTLFPQLANLNNDGQNGSKEGADIDAPEAWSYSRGSCGVVVAVTDTGVDAKHPDLSSNLWVNPGEVAGNGVDDDRDGIVDDVYGADFARGDGNPNDEHGHGTHVAGTIGAVGNNGTGISGVAQRVQIMSIKFLDGNGYGTTADAINAIDFAASHGAQVLNASWGGGAYEAPLREAIQSSGMLFVAASGNSGINMDLQPEYPASFADSNIISVAASDSADELPSYSNYGATSTDIAAPGSDILSTVPGGYTAFSGTSMAAPHVSGAAAVLLASKGSASPEELRSAIMNGGDAQPAFTGKVASGARLNVSGALKELGGAPGPDTTALCNGTSSTTSKLVTAKPSNFSLTSPKYGHVYKTSKAKARIKVQWRASKDSIGIKSYSIKVNGKTLRTVKNPSRLATSSSSPATTAHISLKSGKKHAKRYRIYIVANNYAGKRRKSGSKGNLFFVKQR